MGAFLLFAFFVLGAIVASFIGVVVERLYTGEPIVGGRSRCDSCGEILEPLDLVPIFSWLAFGGCCRACGSRVSSASTIAEVVLGSLFALSYHTLGLTLLLPLFLAALSLLAALVLYDLRHTIVPAVFSTPFIIVALLFSWLSGQDTRTFGLTLMLAGAIALSLALIHALSGGRAMGLGDVPVSFGLALIAGPAALAGFIFSFWIGAFIGIILLARRPKGHRMGVEVPFAPFLAAGFLLAYFTGWNPFALVAMFSFNGALR